MVARRFTDGSWQLGVTSSTDELVESDALMAVLCSAGIGPESALCYGGGAVVWIASGQFELNNSNVLSDQRPCFARAQATPVMHSPITNDQRP